MPEYNSTIRSINLINCAGTSYLFLNVTATVIFLYILYQIFIVLQNRKKNLELNFHQ